MKLTLRRRLYRYLKRRQGVWYSGGWLERLTVEKTNRKASTASRRLRELAEDGLIERKEAKGTVWYRVPHTTVRRIEIVDGVAREIIRNIRQRPPNDRGVTSTALTKLLNKKHGRKN